MPVGSRAGRSGGQQRTGPRWRARQAGAYAFPASWIVREKLDARPCARDDMRGKNRAPVMFRYGPVPGASGPRPERSETVPVDAIDVWPWLAAALQDPVPVGDEPRRLLIEAEVAVGQAEHPDSAVPHGGELAGPAPDPVVLAQAREPRCAARDIHSTSVMSCDS